MHRFAWPEGLCILYITEKVNGEEGDVVLREDVGFADISEIEERRCRIK
jgi:hypothetical protein